MTNAFTPPPVRPKAAPPAMARRAPERSVLGYVSTGAQEQRRWRSGSRPVLTGQNLVNGYAMTMTSLPTLRWTCAAFCFASMLLWVYAVSSDSESFPYRHHLRYVTYLNRKLRGLLMPTCGQWIVVGQILLLELSGVACLGVGDPRLYVVIPLLIVGPAVSLEYLRRERVKKLEAQVDGFMLSFANALRATPNIGNALGYIVDLLPKPMSEEVGLAVQELRLGIGVDQALLNMGARVQSACLDSALMAVLVGRQVGGNLTKVLETTAATLREMARLHRTLRAKTAEAKGQMFVLILFPFVVWFGFDYLYPGHFEPLLASAMGRVILVGALVLWIGSLLVARHVLAVEL